MAFRAQGATEYLVLLAVVLIIALVGIALLGFFPGTASDAQAAESRLYWQSQTPIAISEWAAFAAYNDPGASYIYLRVRNTGAYPIRIKRMHGGGTSTSMVWGGLYSSMSDVYYLAPGEEKYFGGLYSNPWPGLPDNRAVTVTLPTNLTAGLAWSLRGAQTVCANTNNPGTGYGFLQISQFGFEFDQYVEGQTVAKKQIGAKPLMVNCIPPIPG